MRKYNFSTWIDRWAQAVLRGGFWIDERGNVLNLGGKTHERYVVEHLRGKYGLPLYGELTEDDIASAGVADRYEVAALLQDDESRGNGKRVAILSWGWVKVRDNHIEMMKSDRSTFRRIADGLEKAYGSKAYMGQYEIDSPFTGFIEMDFSEIEKGVVSSLSRVGL